VRFRYHVHEQVTIEAGAVVGHNYGDDNELDVASALIRLVYEPVTNLFLIGGTILPTHWIHDALFDDVNIFRGPVEQGLQIRADRQHWKNDLWLNWRIRESTTTAEQFEVGNATQGRWGGARVDGQFLIYHTGGQENTSGQVDTDTALYGGGSYGTKGTKWGEDLGCIEDLRVHGGYFYSYNDDFYADNSSGSGWEVGMYAEIRAADYVMIRPFVSHFEGDDFQAVRGDIMYSNFNEYNQAGVNAVWTLPAGLRAESGFVVQHTEQDRLDYTFQFYLVWGRGFGLFSPK
jgi:hypothetical protein